MPCCVCLDDYGPSHLFKKGGSTGVQMCLRVCERNPVWYSDIPCLCVRVASQFKANNLPLTECTALNKARIISPQISDQVKGPGEFKHITNRRKRN